MSVNTMTITGELNAATSAALKRELRAAQARKRAVALLMIAPLAVFLLLIFVVPIGALLTRAVENPEVAGALPKTVAQLRHWDRESALPDTACGAGGRFDCARGWRVARRSRAAAER